MVYSGKGETCYRTPKGGYCMAMHSQRAADSLVVTTAAVPLSLASVLIPFPLSLSIPSFIFLELKFYPLMTQQVHLCSCGVMFNSVLTCYHWDSLLDFVQVRLNFRTDSRIPKLRSFSGV